MNISSADPKFKIVLRSGASKGFQKFTSDQQNILRENAFVFIDFILEKGLTIHSDAMFAEDVWQTTDKANDLGLRMGLIAVPDPEFNRKTKKWSPRFRIIPFTNTYLYERNRLMHFEYWATNIKKWNLYVDQQAPPWGGGLTYRKSEEEKLFRNYLHPYGHLKEDVLLRDDVYAAAGSLAMDFKGDIYQRPEDQ